MFRNITYTSLGQSINTNVAGVIVLQNREALFHQPKMSAPLELPGGLAYRFRIKKSVLCRVVACYDLFELKDSVFHSPG